MPMSTVRPPQASEAEQESRRNGKFLDGSGDGYPQSRKQCQRGKLRTHLTIAIGKR
jgi:hypothetical protein